MAIQLTPVSSKASLPTAINTLNTVIRQIAANASTNVINQGGGRAVMSGKIKSGQYGNVFYDKNGVARILVGQNAAGDPVIAMSGNDTSILNSNGCWSLGKLTSNRYGQLLYDSNGTPRLVIGQDSNSDPMIALSSGSNSVLTNEKIKIGKLNSSRYGQLFKDSSGTARMVLGEDSNGDPMIALSSGSNSVLTSGNERFKIANLGNNRYGQLLSDSSNIPRLLIGQDSNSDPMIALSSGSNSVLTTEKIKIGKLNSTRYGELFKDSSGTARMVIGEDSNGDPMIALSSGSNSVLTSGKERFKIYNVGSNRYAQVSSDSSDRPRMIFGQSPADGEPVLAITKSGYNVLTELSS